MHAKFSVFDIYVEAIIYLLLYNLYDCTFNTGIDLIRLKRRKDFWILKLDNLTPKALNQKSITFKF